MMVRSALRSDASLPEFLAHRARSASIRRLAADIAVGVAAVVTAVWLRPPATVFLGASGLIFASYGMWGIADRARERTSARTDRLRTILDLLCVLMVGIGVIAFAAVLYSAWTVALGTWIS